MAIGAMVASVVTGFMVLSTGARTLPPVSADFAREAVAFGKQWVTRCLAASYDLGAGHGPVSPLWRLRESAPED